MSAGLTLDTGALIAFDRNDRFVVSLIARALELELGIAVPAGVVAQAWRDGRKQVRLARLLGAPQVQVVDASVALCARDRSHAVATSDEDDLRRLDGQLRLIAV
jgi:predicted nucleic acid-binding protein